MKLFRLFPIALIFLVAFLFPSSALAAGETCAAVVPSDDLKNLVGAEGVRGYTVAQGTDVEEFEVDILGVQENAWLPGDRIVIASASGAPIDTYGGGAAAGMSGSPIYTADGRLLGALAYGFSASPNPIIGITPAEEMTSALRESLPEGIALSEKSQKAASQVADRSVLSLRRIPTVLASSAHPKGPMAKKFARQAEERGMKVVSGSSAHFASPSPGQVLPVPGKTVLPGESIAGELAYGRTSLGGVGTTTWTCDGEFLAFGHPFMNDVATRGVVSRANILTPVVDETWGPYKYGVATDVVGTMTADNNYAIGGTLGAATPTMDVNGALIDKTSGRGFSGMMTQIPQTPSPYSSDWEEWAFPVLSAMSLESEIAKLTNRGPYAYGNFRGGWEIEGTAGSKPFSFQRTDRWSGYEVGDDWVTSPAVDNLWYDLSQIFRYSVNNSAEAIKVTAVRPNLQIESGLRSYRPVSLEWSKGQGWKSSSQIKNLQRGQKVSVRLRMKSQNGNLAERTMRFQANRQQGSLLLENATQPGREFGPRSLEELLGFMGRASQSKLRMRATGLRWLNRSEGALSFDRALEEDISLGISFGQ